MCPLRRRRERGRSWRVRSAQDRSHGRTCGFATLDRATRGGTLAAPTICIMYSKARIAGHAIHPMLVGFPIALFTATIGLELAYIGTQDIFYFRAAMVANIAGVIAALAAVIPGAIDMFALPRESRARGVAKQHALFNLLTVGLFAVSALLLYRNWGGRVMVDGVYALDATIPLALGTVGFVSMVIAGMLGWTLVQTHHVGIKPAAVRANIPSREPELDQLLADLDRLPAPRVYGRVTPYRRPAAITIH
jgi:uncharacterized membrane protein